MNWDQVEGNWKQMKGLLAKKWGKLTDDDFAAAKGSREMLEGRIQERYGLAKEVAQKQVADFLHQHETSSPEHPEVATEGAPVDTQTLKIGM